MKLFKTLLLVALAQLSFALPSFAQTIAIDSVSAPTLCAGDPISVMFTVTGTWEHNNAFTLQLSDTSGSFNNSFTNLGSIKDTVSGSFTILSTVPIKTTESRHYRVRVIGAYPYTESADNGVNLLIGGYPLKYDWNDWMHNPKAPPSVGAVAVGIPHSFQLIDNSAVGNQDYGTVDTVFVDYGEGASPANRTIPVSSLYQVQEKVPVTYSSTGLKRLVSRTVTLGGCSASDTLFVRVYDCTSPTIPSDAIIISNDGTGSSDTTVTLDSIITADTVSGVIVRHTTYVHDTTIKVIGETHAVGRKTYWVNPGVAFHAASYDTIFAEAGAAITGSDGQSNTIVYLKPGASSDIDYDGVVIYAPGASVDKSAPDGAPTIECTDLSFDYTDAPPNSVMHINDAVVTATTQLQVTLTPNPADGIITVAGVPASTVISVMNVLGQTLMTKVSSGSDNVTFDLTPLAAGTYYVRIASKNAVTTKAVVKE